METIQQPAEGAPRHGLILGLPNATYHADSAIGSSAFKRCDQSLLHYWADYIDPAREPRESTPQQVIGSAWHCGTFEPDDFARRYAAKPEGFSGATKLGKLINELMDKPAGALQAEYVAVPEGLDARTKEGKALRAELEATGLIGIDAPLFAEAAALIPQLHGHELLGHDEFRDVQRMTAAARAHPISRVIFAPEAQGVCEASIFAVDPRTGLRVKIRPDFMIRPGIVPMFPHGLIVDGKSSDDVSPEGMGKFVWSWDSYYQAAFYSDVFQQHFGTAEPPPFLWLGQERQSPYAAAYYSAPAELTRFGRRRYRRHLGAIAECLRTGIYPGYSQQVMPVELPAWGAKIVEAELAVGV